MNQQRCERSTKPEKCPRCGATAVADIIYGFVEITDELEKQIDAGQVTLGGCCIRGDEPQWRCRQCRLSIYRKTGKA